jgi:hypothetical protein
MGGIAEHNHKLMPEIKREQKTLEIEPKLFDLDAILSLDLIRTHTKTDDVPSVTDEQLRLYRRAAIEAAEQYTGMRIRGAERHVEHIDKTFSAKVRRKGYMTHTLEYPATDGKVLLYGAQHGLGDRVIHVQKGAVEIRIPLIVEAVDVDFCCRPCAPGSMNFGMKITYLAGFRSPEEIPSGVIVGMLKYIAWNITNPGDIVQTVKNRETAGESGIVGTNNAAWASGAIELWRQYTREGF